MLSGCETSSRYGAFDSELSLEPRPLVRESNVLRVACSCWTSDRRLRSSYPVSSNNVRDRCSECLYLRLFTYIQQIFIHRHLSSVTSRYKIDGIRADADDLGTSKPPVFSAEIKERSALVTLGGIRTEGQSLFFSLRYKFNNQCLLP